MERGKGGGALSGRAAAGRLKEALSRLERAWGRPQPGKTPPLDQLILTILSQNTNDALRDKAYGELRRRYPTWEAALAAGRRRVEAAIRTAGLAEGKSAAIIEVLKSLKRDRGRLSMSHLCKMSDDEAVAYLRGFKGVGEKTARVTLAFSCGKDLFPVDTHVHRVLARLGITPESASPERACKLASPMVPNGDAVPAHLNLIRFGREVCRARKPLCPSCPLSDICPWPHKTTA